METGQFLLFNLNAKFMTFDFKEYKKLLCTAYQTDDFKIAFQKGKEEYFENFDEYLPYPIQDNPDEYILFCNLLKYKIENESLFSLEFITKTEAKTKYKITDTFFVNFYPEPDKIVKIVSSKERFGKSNQYSHLYNENKIVAILESEAFLLYKSKKDTKKKEILNYFN